MQNQPKPLSTFSLTMMNIVIVGSLQMLTSTAVYGYSLLFFYCVAIIVFFIPCLLMTAELATSWPTTGGAYIWVEQAFGKKMGFFTVCILWFCNLIWYPTIFSLISTGFFYLFDPGLVNQKLALFFCVTGIFWLMTLLNCLGIKVSSLITIISGIAGIIIPTVSIMGLTLFWVMSGKHAQIILTKTSLLPSLKDLANIALLTQVVISLSGIEMSAVHAGNVKTPQRDYPLALFYSAFIILLVVMGSALGIALVIPTHDISLVSGLLDALKIFIQTVHLPGLLFIFLLLVTLGNFGCAFSWMTSSTRGMFVACQHTNMGQFLQKTNRFQAPVGILIFEAIIFTLASLVFYFTPSVNASYWILLELASQIALVYYIILFISLVRLRHKHSAVKRYFKIPGGKWGVWTVATLGSITSLFAIVIGFIPPQQTFVGAVSTYVIILSVGILTACAVPIIFLLTRK